MDKITKQHIQNWKEPEIMGRVSPGSELFSELIHAWKKDPRMLEGFPTLNWPAFNQAFGGARPGELIVVTADTGMGKTTFAVNWLMDFCRTKRAGFLVSLEIRWAEMARKIAQLISKKPLKKMTQEDLAGVGDILQHTPLWYFDANGPQRVDFLLKAIKYAAFEKNCQFIVVDHLDYLIRSVRSNEPLSYVIGDTMRQLCTVAHQTDATILLIVHPSKLESKGIGRREIGMDELKGSSSIKQEADAVLSSYRPNPNENETIIRFQKIRGMSHSRNTMSFLRYSFEPDSGQWLETSTKPEWGSL